MDSGEKELSAQGHCFNEKYFEDFFAAHGFKVIAPEKLSIEEQISLIMNADEIATTLGTLSNLAIFCKPEVKLIMLSRTNDPIKVHFQFLANAAAGITDFYYIVANRNFMFAAHYNSACMLGSTEYWKEFVADYFGEKLNEDEGNFYVDETIDEYTDFWSKIYPYDKNPQRWLDALKNMSHRIVALEMEVSKNRPLLNYQTHVSVNGWEEWKLEDELSNPLDQKLDIQAIKIKFSRYFHEIYYSVYYNAEEGWSEEVKTSEIAGTVGKKKPITGIKIHLDEAGTRAFDIFYRMHKFDDTWSSWGKNNETIYSYGMKINAIQVKLEPKFAAAQI